MKNEEVEPKQKQHPVVDETGDGSCIGTRNVRSTNQGKLEVVKQEMARMVSQEAGWASLVAQMVKRCLGVQANPLLSLHGLSLPERKLRKHIKHCYLS